MKIEKKNVIEEFAWNELVEDTYGRPYNFQQQNGCQDRGVFSFTVPSEYTEDFSKEELNHDEMGVSFEAWLKRDPKQPLKDQEYDWELDMWWERNFYPDIHMIINDLHSKGLLDSGEYMINIDW